MDDPIASWEPSFYFLVSYDKVRGVTHVETFDDQEQAFASYLLAERQDDVRGRHATVEVVLIGADSLEHVQETYPHYFAEGSREERLERVVDELVG